MNGCNAEWRGSTTWPHRNESHRLIAAMLLLLGACASDLTRSALPDDRGGAGVAGAGFGGAGGSTTPVQDAAVGADAAAGGAPPADAGVDAGSTAAPAAHFSFFVTSLRAMRQLSGSQNGFGGDLRFGETGDGAGLRGADKICRTIAERSLAGAGLKQWRAFLSATVGGEGGGPVHAIDRIGDGPWYDRVDRLVSNTKAELMQTRPGGAASEIKDDLPNEDGVPNHNPDGTGEVDNHDVLTGTGSDGRLYADDPRVTCDDWTKAAQDSNDAPRVGHSWPRQGGAGGGRPGGGGFNGDNWMSALDEAGCGPGVSIVEMGPPNESIPTVGSGGGYGAIYCFALTP